MAKKRKEPRPCKHCGYEHYDITLLCKECLWKIKDNAKEKRIDGWLKKFL